MQNPKCIFLQLGYFESVYSFQLLVSNYVLFVAKMFSEIQTNILLFCCFN